VAHCYILALPLLFLTLLRPSIYPLTKLLVLRIALPLPPTSPIPSPLTLLISFLTSPLNHLVSSPCYALGHILPTASLTSTPIILMGTPQSSSLWLIPTRLMLIPWSILPFVMNTSTLLTTLMVVTNELSSHLLILLFISMDLLLFPVLLFPCLSQLPLAHYCSWPSYCSLYILACLLWAHYCSQFSTRLCLLLYIKGLC
jgi:hypothetical protein